jgi:hypothetical protein
MRAITILAAAICLAGAGYAQEEPGMANGADVTWTTQVTDYGAKGDGVTDDTAAFQEALDAAGVTGGVCFVPPGQYHIGGYLDVPESVALTGVWQAPHFTDLERGTTLLATGGKGSEDGPPFIMLHRSSAVRGLTIYYPEQDAADIQPYPWCIQGEDTHGSVRDVTLVNPYKGIDFGTHPNEMHFIENVYGQPLKLGIFIDKCTDIGRVQNVHFNASNKHRRRKPLRSSALVG